MPREPQGQPMRNPLRPLVRLLKALGVLALIIGGLWWITGGDLYGDFYTGAWTWLIVIGLLLVLGWVFDEKGESRSENLDGDKKSQGKEQDL